MLLSEEWKWTAHLVESPDLAGSIKVKCLLNQRELTLYFLYFIKEILRLPKITTAQQAHKVGKLALVYEAYWAYH